MSKSGIELIFEERIKQIRKHGYTPEHDSGYKHNELLFAALAYLNTAIYGKNVGSEDWPFPKEFFKPDTDIVENLSKVGAFIAAEIDRIQLVRQKEHDK